MVSKVAGLQAAWVGAAEGAGTTRPSPCLAVSAAVAAEAARGHLLTMVWAVVAAAAVGVRLPMPPLEGAAAAAAGRPQMPVWAVAVAAAAGVGHLRTSVAEAGAVAGEGQEPRLRLVWKAAAAAAAALHPLTWAPLAGAAVGAGQHLKTDPRWALRASARDSMPITAESQAHAYCLTVDHYLLLPDLWFDPCTLGPAAVTSSTPMHMTGGPLSEFDVFFTMYL